MLIAAVSEARVSFKPLGSKKITTRFDAGFFFATNRREGPQAMFFHGADPTPLAGVSSCNTPRSGDSMICIDRTKFPLRYRFYVLRLRYRVIRYRVIRYKENRYGKC
jgi:hypothetical protein